MPCIAWGCCSVQDSQAQLHMPQGCQAQLQGILTGRSECKADLLNFALADIGSHCLKLIRCFRLHQIDLLETPDQFEAKLLGGMFGLPPAS